MLNNDNLCNFCGYLMIAVNFSNFDIYFWFAVWLRFEAKMKKTLSKTISKKLMSKHLGYHVWQNGKKSFHLYEQFLNQRSSTSNAGASSTSTASSTDSRSQDTGTMISHASVEYQATDSKHSGKAKLHDLGVHTQTQFNAFYFGRGGEMKVYIIIY